MKLNFRSFFIKLWDNYTNFASQVPEKYWNKTF